MKYLLIISFLFPLWGAGGFAQKISLKECVDVAIKNNLTYRESQILGESANIELSRAKSLIYPRIGFGTGQDLRVGRSIDRFTNSFIEEVYTTNYFGLQANMMLFNGFHADLQFDGDGLVRQPAGDQLNHLKLPS